MQSELWGQPTFQFLVSYYFTSELAGVIFPGRFRFRSVQVAGTPGFCGWGGVPGCGGVEGCGGGRGLARRR